MRPLTVLLVGKGPPDTGGIAAVLTELQERLRDGFTVDLLNLTRRREYAAGRLSLTNVVRTVVDVWWVMRRAGEARVVDIHSAFVPAVTAIRAGMLALAARSRRARVIIHVHGGDLPRWASNRRGRLLLRLALVAVDRVVAVSSDVMRTIPGDKSVLIPNGVDTARFHPPAARDNAPPVIVYVGLLTERKGVVDLIEASSLLAERRIAHRLVLVGGRPDEGQHAERRVRESARGTEQFLGAVPHERIPELLQNADVFCLPSWYEAMPLSILEAMASGLPTVATAVGQIPEMVDDTTGILVPPRDPEMLADALQRMLADGPFRRRLGVAARERAVERFSIEQSTRRLKELMGTLLGDE